MNTKCTKCGCQEFTLADEDVKVYMKNNTKRIRFKVKCHNCKTRFIADGEVEKFKKENGIV